MTAARLPPSALRLGTFNVGQGLKRKLPQLLSSFAAANLDAVALQEIGDPALLHTRFPSYTLIYSAGPSLNQAGVGFLLAHALVPCIRSYHRSDSGRIFGVMLELSKGHRLLLISAYMPTGLDHRSAASPERELADKLYLDLIRWSVDAQQVVLLGDLNETLTPADRHPPPPSRHAAPAASIDVLIHEGFTDVWRTLHPDAITHAGFTHSVPGGRSHSRIDYIWTKGISRGSLYRAHISAALRALSHHQLLWVELHLPHVAPRPPPPLMQPLRLPNLRALSDDQRQAFSSLVQRKLAHEHDELSRALAEPDAASLSHIATHLTQLVHRCAHATLPITGDTPLRSRCIMQLQQQRHDLTRLITISSSLISTAAHTSRAPSRSLTHSPEWRTLFQHCITRHAPLLQWTEDASNSKAWLAETRQLLRCARHSIREERRRMLQSPKAPLDANPAARIHRMMRSDALPSQLLSVVDSNDELTSSADELKAVMVDHFRSVFTIPPPDAAPLPHPVPAMLLDKDTVQSEWYAGLMADISTEELLATLADTPLVTAPGEDGVASGLWKLALHSSDALCKHIAALCTACLRTSTFPSAWKSSIIVPLVKDAKKERTMSNVRPISLQSCLGKLLNKLLAHRLGSIFARHPILHPAQRGFINGGAIIKCIDELLDAWDWSRAGKHEQYTLFYDIKQAYDSVQTDVLERALRRLRMPDAFIALVVDSLTGLQSQVRTAYGLTESFAVERSLRQGDPLAPLLFVALMDALHDGLERNPFTGQQHGFVMTLRDGVQHCVASLGYADDTNVLTNTLQALRHQNDWVHFFMRFNRMRLNHGKCELVGRCAAGAPVQAAALAHHGITIEGNAVQPVSHDLPIRYLGVHVTYAGSWVMQQNKALAKIACFTRLVNKFSLTIAQAVYMFNVFLLPTLELALHYVHGAGATGWIKSCDRLIIGSIKHAAGASLKLSHSAVALSVGLLLPSWLETSIKVSELLLRCNDRDHRWGHLGRLLLQEALPVHCDAAAGHGLLAGARRADRTSRARLMACMKLRWQLMRHELPRDRAGSRHVHLLDEPPGSSAACSSATLIQLNGARCLAAHDVWHGWGLLAAAHTIHVYTDGSHDSSSLPHPTSSWAVTIADQWLEDNFGTVPADESMVRPHHLHGATIFGASIACTQGVYPAELQAIARALAMFPLSFTLHVHSDSKSSLQAIHRFESLTNERARLRMPAHTILHLILHLLQARLSAGGSVHWHHVRAHTNNDDIHSVGNRLADFVANKARLKPDRQQPLSLRELPLPQCEMHLRVVLGGGAGLQLIDDARSAATLHMQHSALEHWQQKKDNTRFFASQAISHLGRVVLKHGSAELQASFVLLATHSLHYMWLPDKGGLHEMQCDTCAAPIDDLSDSEDDRNHYLTPSHLTSCTDTIGVRFRERLRLQIINTLHPHPAAQPWLRQHQHASLSSILLSLCPTSAAASAANQPRHLTYVMCGVLTTTQVNAAVRTLGFTDPLDVTQGQRAVRALQLLCLDHVRQVYATRKDRILRAA